MSCPDCPECSAHGCDACDDTGMMMDRSDDLFIPDDYLVPCETCCKVLPEGRERFCDDVCAAKEASPDTAAVSFRESHERAWEISRSVR